MPRHSYEAAAAREKFGRRIRDARLAAGLTQSQAAERAGITSFNLSEIECGVQNMRMTTMIALAKAVGMEVRFLLKKPEL
jgi:transcriptional regulator with XRE-family HTH domain